MSLSSTCITLFVIPRNNHATATTIFTKIENRTGWSSDGFAFMLAVGNSVFAYLGGDCAAKMAEEVPNPSKTIPLVTLFPPIIGLITAFPFLTSLMYSVTDLDAVLTNTRGLPLFEIYRQGTQSHIGASVLLGIFAFFQFSTLIACGELSFYAFSCLTSSCRLNIMNKPPQRHEPCGPLLGTVSSLIHSTGTQSIQLRKFPLMRSYCLRLSSR